MEIENPPDRAADVFGRDEKMRRDRDAEEAEEFSLILPSGVVPRGGRVMQRVRRFEGNHRVRSPSGPEGEQQATGKHAQRMRE